MLSKKAAKNDEIFTVNLTLCSKYQIDDLISPPGLVCIEAKIRIQIEFFSTDVDSYEYNNKTDA